MNPENRGQQIALRHSSLWRNTMFVEKDNNNREGCHGQLNESIYSFIQWDKLAKVGTLETISFGPTSQASETNQT